MQVGRSYLPTLALRGGLGSVSQKGLEKGKVMGIRAGAVSSLASAGDSVEMVLARQVAKANCFCESELFSVLLE